MQTVRSMERNPLMTATPTKKRRDNTSKKAGTEEEGEPPQ